MGTKQDDVKLCSVMSGCVCSGKDVCMWKAWMCAEKDAPWARQVLDRVSSRASHRGADLTRHKSRESKQRGWTKSRKGRSGFMRLINVVMVWAQRHSFEKKKKKNEPIPHMTSRQRSWSRPRWCLEWGCSHTRPTSANGVCSTLMHVGESLRPSGFEHLEQKHGSYHQTHIFISSMAKLTAFLKIQRINMQPPACFYRLMFPHFWGRQQMQKLSDVQTIH